MEDNVKVLVVVESIDYKGTKYFKDETVKMDAGDVEMFVSTSQVSVVNDPKDDATPATSQPETAGATISVPPNSEVSAPSTGSALQSKPVESSSPKAPTTSAPSATKPTDNFMGKHKVGGNGGPNDEQPLRKSAL